MPVPKNPNDPRGSRPGQRRQGPPERPGPRPPQGPSVLPGSMGQPRPGGLGGPAGPGATPEQQQALASLNSRFSSLSGRITLGSLRDQLEDMSGKIGSLGPTLANLRARGYRYGRGWEQQVEALSTRWTSQAPDARRILDERVAALQSAAQSAQMALQRSQRESAWQNTAERQISQLEQQLSSAESDVRGAFDQTSTELAQLTKEFKQVAALQEALATGKFELYPDEAGVALCKAKWLDEGDEPEGILVLTDGRLILEQREKKATKKLLFITTGSETVQRLLFEAPVGTIEELEASDTKGVLGIGNKELLNLRFSKPPKDAPSRVTLSLLEGARNEEWSALIRRVQSGQIEAERYDVAAAAAGETPASAPQTPVNIPSDCPACGAKLPAYVKGMRQLECGYCGRHVSLF